VREGLTRRWLIAVLAAVCLPAFLGLGRADLENDEGIYSFAVDGILARGDWLNPPSSPDEHVVFLEKPPLKFWIVAAPIALGLLPHDEFGLRFWDAVAAVAALMYVFAIGRRLTSPAGAGCGVLLLLGFGPLWFDHGLRGNYMEAPLFLCYCAGVHHFLAWSDGGTAARRRGHIAAVAAAFFLGFMTKFVAALFLPPVLLASALATAPSRRALRADRAAWLIAGAGAAALAAPWFVYEQLHAGRVFWHTILGVHVITRFTSSLDPAHLHPWHFYVTWLARELQHEGVAWLAAAGIVVAARQAWRGRDLTSITMLVWLVVPLLLISAGTSKLPHYAYPFLPPLALASGAALWLGFERFGPPMLMQVRRAVAWMARPQAASRAARVIVLFIALAAIVLGLQTLVLGRVTWRAGGVQLLRNADLTPPVAIAAAALAFLGWLEPRRTLAVAIVLLIFGRAYEDTVRRALVQSHPLRTARDCLLPIRSRAQAEGAQPPPLLAIHEGAWFQHSHYYYLRGLGWDRAGALDRASADAAFEETPRPVLLGSDDLERLAAVTGRDLAAVPAVQLPNHARLLLPGPYAPCAAAATAASAPR
jgi:4-amino-4-deoxy-L-arabinose transferase-like glycosyltransferase